MPATRRIGLITKSNRRTAVAIVGGGASGTILAAQLAKRGIKSVIIDGSGRAGRGVAYSTRDEVHLLNVRAEAMSAWAGEPDHFAKRVAAQGREPRSFAERQLFGEYLGEILDEAIEKDATQVMHAMAVRAVKEGRNWRVGADDSSVVEANALVLATGNHEPDTIAAFDGMGSRFIGNPWGDAARAAVDDLASRDAAALLVGTGLTMVDLALSLDAAGHRGPAVALSRRGLVPRSHADFTAAPVERGEVPRGLRAILRWLRRRGAEVGWRAAVDSLRPHTHSIWQGLTGDEQRQFLRHARPWWDVHRHRIAPEVAAMVSRMIAEGRLQIVAGRIVSASATPAGIEVSYRRRGMKPLQSKTFAYVFNCTGPLHSIARSKDRLLRSLLDAHEVKPDELGIGLHVDEACRAGDHLWAMGALTKGRFWETIAVPDIREQAAAVAADIERELA
ncbi:MAG TPA: FAD/NAD(P)-binding protein [Sphingomicrobium sp.]|nr:FAD/NAD(P)-binding protein [Sphingomicrobium sp.]